MQIGHQPSAAGIFLRRVGLKSDLQAPDRASGLQPQNRLGGFSPAVGVNAKRRRRRPTEVPVGQHDEYGKTAATKCTPAAGEKPLHRVVVLHAAVEPYHLRRQLAELEYLAALLGDELVGIGLIGEGCQRRAHAAVLFAALHV